MSAAAIHRKIGTQPNTFTLSGIPSFGSLSREKIGPVLRRPAHAGFLRRIGVIIFVGQVVNVPPIGIRH
jgi:hypothetical protein